MVGARGVDDIQLFIALRIWSLGDCDDCDCDDDNYDDDDAMPRFAYKCDHITKILN